MYQNFDKEYLKQPETNQIIVKKGTYLMQP